MEEKIDNKSCIYMNWAKTRSASRFNLATSGLMHYPLKNLRVEIENLEISGPTFYGYEPLQKALAVKCGVEPDSIAAAIGTSMANHLVMAALIDPGDEVIIESPTYEPLIAVARYLGAKIKRFQREFSSGFQVDVDQVHKLLNSRTKLIVVTNLHNPSGARIPNETLRRLGDLAKNAGSRILIDEVYLECLYESPGSKISAFHLGNEFIATSSLTKAYGLSGLRCGWILAEPDLIQKFWRINDLFSATPSHIAELLSIIALNRLPEISQWASSILQTNRVHLNRFLDLTADHLEVARPELGTVCFPRLKSGDCDRFIETLRNKYETSVVPGRFFEMPDHFRIGIGGPEELLREGLQNIQQALKSE